MYIARWHFIAKFGYKSEALELLNQWVEEVGSQTGIDFSTAHITTGSIGAPEGYIENQIQLANLEELDRFFEKIATVTLHADWGKRMSAVVVDGTNSWDILRVVK